MYYSQILISETTLEFNYGRRYGLIGPNGCGKSTFLKSLAAREIPIPEHIDIYLLNEEFPPTEMTALKAVIEYAEKELKVYLAWIPFISFYLVLRFLSLLNFF